MQLTPPLPNDDSLLIKIILGLLSLLTVIFWRGWDALNKQDTKEESDREKLRLEVEGKLALLQVDVNRRATQEEMNRQRDNITTLFSKIDALRADLGDKHAEVLKTIQGCMLSHRPPPTE